MSDYLFSSLQQTEGKLAKIIENIYDVAPPATQEFHGKWGVLAVSQSHYHGFQPYETEEHLLIVIGGPVLCFRDNDFLVEDDSDIASQAIYERWITEGNIQWDEDLSGPFTILLVNKSDSTLQVVTDLMAFIPVYACEKESAIFIGTHIDALAKCSGEIHNLDQVSLADFILNDVITYPYTAYENLKQLAPSSTTAFKNKQKVSVDAYWEPIEHNKYSSIMEAATELRNGIQGYVNRITDKMDHVGQFISGGEDSRVLSGILPARLKRDGYIFLDKMNREGHIAKKVAKAYGVDIAIGYRAPTHYLDILSEASKLVGTGHQYHHAHSLGFDKKYNLKEYSAVFGGYLSDSLLKGAYAYKVKGTTRFPFIPDILKLGQTRTNSIKSKYITNEILEHINIRRIEHFNKINELRPNSVHEWFVLYPATMRTAIPNLYTTRRLFKSYEPFMCNDVVKISAMVPTNWKLNRRLFNKAMKPYLFKSKKMFHGDGRLPFYPWWVNTPILFFTYFYRKLAKSSGLIKGNQSSWTEWSELVVGIDWHKRVDALESIHTSLNFVINDNNIEELLLSSDMKIMQKVNLLQLKSTIKR